MWKYCILLLFKYFGVLSEIGGGGGIRAKALTSASDTVHIGITTLVKMYDLWSNLIMDDGIIGF